MARGKKKSRGTFIVKVLHGQHSTWQGTVTWVDEHQDRNFRSALELLKIIDGALEQNDEDDDDIEGGSHEE